VVEFQVGYFATNCASAVLLCDDLRLFAFVQGNVLPFEEGQQSALRSTRQAFAPVIQVQPAEKGSDFFVIVRQYLDGDFSSTTIVCAAFVYHFLDLRCTGHSHNRTSVGLQEVFSHLCEFFDGAVIVPWFENP
jgi:hypothetical protein